MSRIVPDSSTRLRRCGGFSPSRRTFLRGAGVTLALPLLQSALPRSTWGAEFETPTRLLFYYVPNGINGPYGPGLPDAWVPTVIGPDYDLTAITAPLAPVQQHVSQLTGLANHQAELDGVPGDHARGTGGFLTGVTIKRTTGADIQNGVSVDQVVAADQGTRFASLQVGIKPGGNTGDCTAGYSCAYTRNISWATATTPLPNITDAGLLYDRLFGVNLNLSPEMRSLRTAAEGSLLGKVLDQSNSLHARLGSADRVKLEQYLDALSEVEQRVDSVGGGACTSGDRPPTDVAYAQHVDLMQRLMVTALQCDQTRVVTFMLGEAASNQSYDFIGVPGSHHELSHHQDDQTKLAQLQIIGNWEVQQFANLVQLMSDTPDGQGTLLDSVLALWSSEIRDGNTHTHTDLPVLLAGSGNGAHLPGRHLAYDGDRPVEDLLLSLALATGADLDRVGPDGTTPLEDLAG